MCHANILWAWGSSSSLAWSTSMQNTVLTWESAIIPTFQLHDITFRMLFLLLGALSYVWGTLKMHDGWQQALCLPVSEVHCKGTKELKVNPFSAEQKHGGSSTTVMVKLHFTCNFHSLALHFAFKWVKASTKLKVKTDHWDFTLSAHCESPYSQTAQTCRSLLSKNKILWKSAGQRFWLTKLEKKKKSIAKERLSFSLVSYVVELDI